MTDLLQGGYLPWFLGSATAMPILLCAFLPVFVVRIIARIYPPGHPRRRELPAEMHHAQRYRDRPAWLAEQFALALTEGLSERLGWTTSARLDLRLLLLNRADVMRLGSDVGMVLLLCGSAWILVATKGTWAVGALPIATAVAIALRIVSRMWRLVRSSWTSKKLVEYLLTGRDNRG